MGGSGGSYFPRSTPQLDELVKQAMLEAEKERLDSDINKLLREIIASYERDHEKINEYLKIIGEILKDEGNMQKFLFGGSVAKHTYVDGLSDVDALVILRQEELAEKSPRTVLDHFHKLLQNRLTQDKVKSVDKGTLAVTVTYRDGTEIQLLPAIQVGKKIYISGARANKWNETNPRTFQKALTNSNQRLNNLLIPTIKLAKSIILGFPKQNRLTGYHVEALALDAVKGYRGPKSLKALLTHIFEEGSKRVIHPISDVTGQERTIDSYLGKANSPKRRAAANDLENIARRLNKAKSIRQWKAILED